MKMKFKLKLNFKILTGYFLLSSLILSFISDLAYGKKNVAEEYMVGIFLTHIATFLLTLSTIIILISLIFYLIKKMNPLILSKLKFDDEDAKNAKGVQND